MTTEADAFSIQLLDEAKRFMEKGSVGSTDERNAYLHAALIVGFSALESHLNGIADELSTRPQTSLLDNSLLLEREVKIDKGEWQLGREKFFRLEDRISFLIAQYAKRTPSSYAWWSDLLSGIKERNALVHPREVVVLTPADVERFLSAIVDSLNDLYVAVFGKGHPSFKRGLQSTMSF
ncbi:hypothetical protein NVV95_17965 [Herbiconiux sp. CPCC 205716]|uniref:RiboL-PSP-HEPN domain-containing protein n=1 Tax=Herbiconiux gentiana TaxID=2970912 RepID=A0ABT2GJQ4_9MICO|nr:hypothetical protein [Herbiconiux gentiana]MCS5716437.1 hypothetical protein [Herbiconiux gentiana]